MINNQRNYVFPVGFGEQPCYQVGCTISVIGNIFNKTPLEINDLLKANGGFSDGQHINQGNLVVWAALEKIFPGTKVKRVYQYNNDEVKANTPNVVVEVPSLPIGGRGSHWVRYIGNQLLEDPWTGKVRHTSDFPNPTGYCIIIPPKPTGGLSSDQKVAKITEVLYDKQLNSDQKVEKGKQIIA